MSLDLLKLKELQESHKYKSYTQNSEVIKICEKESTERTANSFIVAYKRNGEETYRVSEFWVSPNRKDEIKKIYANERKDLAIDEVLEIFFNCNK